MCRRERLYGDEELTRDGLIALVETNQLEWQDHEHEGEPGILIRCPCDKCENEKIHVSLAALPGLRWPQIYRAVIGGRHVIHVTRVVGYYSKVENWNPSKKSELADRKKGDYSIH